MLGIAGLTGGPFSDSREVYLLNEGRRGYVSAGRNGRKMLESVQGGGRN